MRSSRYGVPPKNIYSVSGCETNRSVKTAPETIKYGPAIPIRNARQQQASRMLSRCITVNYFSEKRKKKTCRFIRIISNVIALGLVNQIGMGLSNTVLDFGTFISTCIAARKPLADAPHGAVGLGSPLAIRNFSVPEKFGRHEDV